MRNPFLRENQVSDKYREAKNAEMARTALRFIIQCPLCRIDSMAHPPGCPACRGELNSQEVRQANIRSYMAKRKDADREISELLEYLDHASPEVRLRFVTAIRRMLADDLQKASTGKWKGELALGLSVGNTIGNLVE